MEKKKIDIPVALILLDLVGAVLAAMGILGALNEGGASDYLMVVAGFLLMLPLVLHILNRLQKRR
ncbi:MAG: hypothetical protein R3E57_02820 [Porticoccaceae bacterium]